MNRNISDGGTKISQTHSACSKPPKPIQDDLLMQEDCPRLRDVRISTSTAGRVVFLYREMIPLPDLVDHRTDLVALEHFRSSASLLCGWVWQ